MSGTKEDPRWLSAEEQQAWRATVHLSQLLMRQLDRDLTAHGLSARDYEILVELSEAAWSAGMTARAISAAPSPC